MLHDMLFLEHEGAPIAYAWTKPFGETGRVMHVVVDPAWRGRGAGARLMEAVADRLRAAGCAHWELNVKTDNVPAIRLYERVGFSAAHRSAALWFPWERVAALPSIVGAAPPVEARAIEPAEDAALEAAFGLLAGRLAQLRALSRVLVKLVDPADSAAPAVGVASFFQAMPGAYPFVVARPALAAPLLAALREHAGAGDARIHLIVEDDALTAALVAAGGVVSFELFHMVGALGRG